MIYHHSKVNPELKQRIEDVQDRAAGGLIISKDTGNILLGLRSSGVENPNTNGVFGGRFEDYESPEEALEREIFEETGYPLFGGYKPLCVYYNEDNGFAYHTQIAFADHDFEVTLNWEHDSAKWMTLEEVLALPKETLHHGLAEAISDPTTLQELKKISEHYLNKAIKNPTNEQGNEIPY